MSEGTDMNKEFSPSGGGGKEFSRKDFLRLATLVTLGLTASACGMSEVDASDFPIEPTVGFDSGAVSSPEAAIPGIEATEAVGQRIGEVVAISSQESLDSFFAQIDMGGVKKEAVEPFGVKVDEVTFDFVLIPQTVDESGQVVEDEKLGMKVGEEWQILTRAEFQNTTDGQRYVMWQYLPEDPTLTGEPVQLEPVLWYRADPSLIELLAFAPPSELSPQISFDRAGGRGIEIPYEGVSGGVKGVLAREIQSVLISEADLEPSYIQETSVEFMGVQINAQLITDKSLDPIITKVTVTDNAYAEFIARTIFRTWWKKGNEAHTGIPTEQDFKTFMALWAIAQETGAKEDWEKVQINEIWANNLNDGNGYIQKPYSIWFMYNGEEPEGVNAVTSLKIVIVNGPRHENITLFSDNGYGQGMGTNIDGSNLVVYNGLVPDGGASYSDWSKRNWSVASSLAATSWWLVRNVGGPYSGYGSENLELEKLLLNGGSRISP